MSDGLVPRLAKPNQKCFQWKIKDFLYWVIWNVIKWRQKLVSFVVSEVDWVTTMPCLFLSRTQTFWAGVWPTMIYWWQHLTTNNLKFTRVPTWKMNLLYLLSSVKSLLAAGLLSYWRPELQRWSFANSVQTGSMNEQLEISQICICNWLF